MSSPTSSLALILALAACGSKEESKVATAAPDDRIDCAVNGAADFTESCAVEQGESTLLILRHADGGFRRIDLAPDGTLSAPDGSDVAGGKMLADGRFELVIGGDRYRLPPRK